MALNCPPVEPFGYNGDYHDSFQDYEDDNRALVSDNLVHSNSPVLNFNREDECDLWIDSMDRNYCGTNYPSESSFDMTKVHSSSISRAIGENGRYSFSYPMTSHIDYVQESLKQHRLLQKGRFEGTEMQMAKKQCQMHRKSRGKTNSPSKDPQNHTAKNRRERISERLKVLQELVPNGTKVDLVTMLEKAISYVQFLQLQVKVLATDEFWPEQGGKALDISQVKQALDAILSSKKEKLLVMTNK